MNDPVFAFAWEGKAVGINDRYAYRTSKKLTYEYEAFMSDIAWTCRAANPKLAARPIRKKLFIVWTQCISNERDSDSLIKPLFDGIELSGVITNDNKIRNYNCTTIDKQRGEMDSIKVKAYLLEDDND